MKYDFTSVIERKGHDALALDAPEEALGKPVEWMEDVTLIPMWVADMNFPVFPGIQKAVSERLSHPAFGYFLPSDEYYDSIIWWQETRHGVTGLTRCAGRRGQRVERMLLQRRARSGTFACLHRIYEGFEQ